MAARTVPASEWSDVDLDSLRLEHGKLVRVDLGGRSFAFRPLHTEEAEAIAERLERAPELALDTAFEACRECCVGVFEGDRALDDPRAALDEAADLYPLIFSAETGVCDKLLTLASEALAKRIKDAISRWRKSDRNLGMVAESLLAFQAYRGGQASAEAMAGALHMAEHLDFAKGLYRLHLSFMRALGKRRG